MHCILHLPLLVGTAVLFISDIARYSVAICRDALGRRPQRSRPGRTNLGMQCVRLCVCQGRVCESVWMGELVLGLDNVFA